MIRTVRRTTSIAAMAVVTAATSGRAQQAEEAAVRRVVESVASATAAKNVAALDSVFAPDAWVLVIEGAGVNRGWLDYRDNHLRPELAEFHTITYQFFEIEPQVRGAVAWAPFRYELSVHTDRGPSDLEGRGTAILENRSGRWVIVHLHTSGRRRPAR